MKNLIVIIILCVLTAISTSCEKMFGTFLDKAPGVDITIDTVFSSRTNMEMLLAQTYFFASPQGFYSIRYQIAGGAYSQNVRGDIFDLSLRSDEAEIGNTTPSGFSHNYHMGVTDVTNATDINSFYVAQFYAIREIYTMLENIDRVPDADKAYKETVKAEMKWLLGGVYYELWIRYGGVPIIKRTYKPDEKLSFPRSSCDSTYQFIIKNLDEAAAVLPNSWTSNWRGRATKGAALALKAKAMLFAASPLFNSATPYLDMPNSSDNKLICFGKADPNRWRLAADAAKAVLDWAPSGGVALITDQGVDKNYKYAWEAFDNSEIIWAEKSLGNESSKHSDYSSHWAFIVPMPMSSWNGVCPTQNFIEKFYDNADGTPQAPWAAAGTDLNQRYASLEPRFKQTIGYNGSRWNNLRPVLETFSPNGLYFNGCYTGYWMKKWIPDAVNTAWVNYPANFPYLRLNEQYLIYAEALNESNPTPPQAAYDAVNTIRARSGMPNLPTGLTQAQFRAKVVKEWGVEFAFENHRYWDLKRWKTYDQEGAGPFYKLLITKSGSGTPQPFQYAKSVYETRVWPTRNYLDPFQTLEVLKAPGVLLQNPGY